MSEPKENFLRDFVRLSEKTEIPELFSMWCGLSCISCVLSRRVWVERGHLTTYPNMYVILVAGSGQCRKSTAISEARKLLCTLTPSPNLLSQKVTPEALIESLTMVDTENGEQFLRKTSEGFIIIDELSTFLNKHSYDAGIASMLTTLWDCTNKFEYRTRGKGCEIITNSCLGILAGSTIDWVRNAIPTDAIGGGLTSRIIFVYVNTPNPPVAWPTQSPEKAHLTERLIKALNRIQMMEGPMRPTPDAQHLFIQSYNHFYKTSSLYGNKASAGYASRRFDYVLKIAMLFSAAEGRGDMLIDTNHVQGALSCLQVTESSMFKVLNLIMMNEKGSITDEVLRYIETKPNVTRSSIIKAFSHKIDMREITGVLETLKAADMIDFSANGQNYFYKVKG